MYKQATTQQRPLCYTMYMKLRMSMGQSMSYTFAKDAVVAALFFFVFFSAACLGLFLLPLVDFSLDFPPSLKQLYTSTQCLI